MKQLIKISEGRAYLHTSGWFRKEVNIRFESIKPLGNDPDFIKNIKKILKCKIKFL